MRPYSKSSLSAAQSENSRLLNAMFLFACLANATQNTTCHSSSIRRRYCSIGVRVSFSTCSSSPNVITARAPGSLGTSGFVAFLKSHLVRRWSSETHSRKLRARKHRQTQSQKTCLFVTNICVTEVSERPRRQKYYFRGTNRSETPKALCS